MNEFVTMALGSYIGIIGLVGTFFYLQLGSWLQGLNKLEVKYINIPPIGPERNEQFIELRVEIAEYQDGVFLELLYVVNTFFVIIFIFGFSLVVSSNDALLIWFIGYPFLLFDVLFVFISVRFARKGSHKIEKITAGIESWELTLKTDP